MKKLSSLILSAVLILSVFCNLNADAAVIPGQKDVFTEFYSSGSATWQSNMNEGVDRWATSCAMYVRPYAENIATVTLKPNTTYVFNACYRNLDSGTKAVFYDGAYGFAISTADFTGTNIADNCLNKGTFNTSVPEGQTYGYIVDQTFTTTDATEYKFRFGFAPTSAGGRIVLENCTLEEVPVQHDYSALYMQGSAKWSSNRDLPVQGEGYVEMAASPYSVNVAQISLMPLTDYSFSAVFKNKDDSKAVLNYGDYGVSIIPLSGFDGQLDSAACVENKISTSDWSKNNTSVASGSEYGYINNINFTTTDETEYIIRFAFSGESAGSLILESCRLTEIMPTPDISAGVALSEGFNSTNTASIRLASADQPQGIRVKTTIRSDILGEGNCGGATVIEYGTLAARTENLKGLALTLDMVDSAFAAKKGIAYSTADNKDIIFAEEGGLKTYTGVLINIPEEYYDESYTVRPYIILKEQDDTEVLYYLEEMQLSVKTVAEAILADENAPEQDRNVAETIINSTLNR